MPNKPAETIAQYFAALRAMDTAAWVDTFAPDAISNDPVGAPPMHGHAALIAFADGIFSLFTNVGLTEQNVFLNGNTAAVKWIGTGTGKNGAAVTFEGIDVITVNEAGKISLVNAYWDPTPVVAAVSA